MAESVVVGVRVRPYNDREKNLNAKLCIEMNGPTTTITDLGKDDVVTKDFTFDESFWSHDGFEDDGNGYMKALPGSKYADQRRVYEVFGERVLQNAWEGFHCCLFAYGQTGAGKSYSMVGYGANKGIVPISCEEIFKRISGNSVSSKRFEVTVSMVEIYNEAVQDLLILPEDRPKKGLEIRESKLLGIYIDGVTRRPVDSYAAIEETIEEATNHRTIGSTLMNATSSRAHTVQTIEFKQIENIGGSDQVKVSMINLVDLAGSEKAGQTGASGDRLKEGAAINKSLSALGNVIEKLAEKSSGKKNIIIPYRDSKLTRLLQNALGGSSKTIMICALSPASSNYEETLSTLRYADRAKKIKNNAVVNENPQEKLLRELREENSKLKELMQQMQGGETPDMQVMKEMQEKQQEMADAQAALDEMGKSFDQRLAESKTLHDKTVERERTKRRASMGRSVINTANHTPVLVNLNADPQLTCRIRYNLEEGKFLRVGTFHAHHNDNNSSDSDEEESDEDEGEPEIMLHHSSVYHHHAKLYNTEGVVRICSEGDAADHTFINGESVSEVLTKQKEEKASQRGSLMDIIFGRTPSQEGAPDNVTSEGTKNLPDTASGVVLNHGDRIVFGECCFFYCEPQQGLPEVMVATKQVDYAKAVSELSKVSSKWLTASNKLKALTAIGVKNEVAELEEQVRVLKEGGVRHQQELSDRDALIESAVEQAEELAKINAEVAQSSEEKDAAIEKLKGEVQLLESAKAELERLNAEASQRTRDLEASASESATGSIEKDSIIEKLREEVRSLQDDIRSKTEALDLQRIETEKVAQRTEVLEASNKDAEQAGMEKDSIIKRLEDELQELTAAKQDTSKLTASLEEATSKAQELETSRRALEKSNEEKDATIVRLQEEAAKRDVAESKDHVEVASGKDDDIVALTKEMTELRRLNEELSSKHQRELKDSEERSKVVEELKAQNATLQEAIQGKSQGNGTADPTGAVDDSRQRSLAESITASFHEAVKALDTVESSLTDLVSKREQSRKAAEYPMF